MRVILAVCSLIILWPWLAATVLTVAFVGVPWEVLQRGWAVPVWTSLIISPAAFILLAWHFRYATKDDLKRLS